MKEKSFKRSLNAIVNISIFEYQGNVMNKFETFVAISKDLNEI